MLTFEKPGILILNTTHIGVRKNGKKVSHEKKQPSSLTKLFKIQNLTR